MDSKFGEFITKEYGLLKQILSYLKPADLHNARFVCREWRKAVDNLVEKNPLVISYKHNQEHPMAYPTKPILPCFVIYQNVASEEFMRPNKCPNCKQLFLICYCELTGPETTVITLNNLPVLTPYDPDLYPFWQLPSIIAFSSREDIKQSTFSCEWNKKALAKLINTESQTDIDGIKGVFVVSKSCCRKITEKILNDAVDKQGPTFAVGGGIADSFAFNKIPVKRGRKQSGVLVIFRGDNVAAHSELITGRDASSIEQSMAKLKERTGEVPEGGFRLAFIAQCVDRKWQKSLSQDTNLEKLEFGLFRRYFPDVPLCGFPAWGEYGIKSGSSDDQSPRNKSKRKKISFCHAFTTSILIVTLRKS